MRITKAEFSGFERLADGQINLDHKVVSIDWDRKKSVRAAMRRLLAGYDRSSDTDSEAVELEVEQAGLFAASGSSEEEIT